MPQKTKGCSSIFQGAEYTKEESDFLRGIAKFKADHNKQILDCKDVLAIAKSLGYRRTRQKSPLPKFTSHLDRIR